MKTAVLNTFLLLLVVALVSANVLLRTDPDSRQVEFFPDMAHSLAFDSFSANPNFADGKTLRAPVPGTVIRGHMPLHYAATPEDAKRAGIELTSSVAASDAAALARGQWVYEQFCMTCHGPSGKGDGVVATRGFPMPASLLAPRALAMPDGQMFHVLTYGQGNMPSYAAQVGREDRWKSIGYVRKLQGTASGVGRPASGAPPSAAPRPTPDAPRPTPKGARS